MQLLSWSGRARGWEGRRRKVCQDKSVQRGKGVASRKWGERESPQLKIESVGEGDCGGNQIPPGPGGMLTDEGCRCDRESESVMLFLENKSIDELRQYDCACHGTRSRSDAPGVSNQPWIVPLAGSPPVLTALQACQKWYADAKQSITTIKGVQTGGLHL